jgi:hypothetical protein
MQGKAQISLAPRAQLSINFPRRLRRVSSFLALTIHAIVVRW